MRVTVPIYGGKRGGVLGYRVVRDDERDRLKAALQDAEAKLAAVRALCLDESQASRMLTRREILSLVA